jgi:hypothetical protein
MNVQSDLLAVSGTGAPERSGTGGIGNIERLISYVMCLTSNIDRLICNIICRIFYVNRRQSPPVSVCLTVTG